MMFLTHLAGAILFSLIFLRTFGFSDLMPFVFCMLGAIFPDIDSTKSFIGKRVWIVGFLSKHRNLFHSAILAALLSVGIYLVLGRALYATGFLLGYISHIALDSLTVSGTAALYPFSKRRIMGFFRTNSLMEHIILAIFLILIIYLLL